MAIHAREKKYPHKWAVIIAMVLGVVIGILIEYYVFHGSPTAVHVVNGIGSHGNIGKVITRAPKVRQNANVLEPYVLHILHGLHVHHLSHLHRLHVLHLARVRASLRA